MVFKPSIQNPHAVGGDAFPNVVNFPCSVVITVDADPDWFAFIAANGLTPEAIADQIVGQYQGQLWHFINAQRQGRQLAGQTGVSTYLSWDDMDVQYIYNHGQETLRITVYPSNAGAALELIGGTFGIKWPFTAFPYPGMSQNGGTRVPSVLQYSGVQYVYDSGFSPSAPGPTSKVNSNTGVITCATPITKPDLNQMLQSQLGTSVNAAEQLLYSQMMYEAHVLIPTIDQSAIAFASKTIGYSQDLWSIDVGGAAILTTPLAGLQYWEVQIIKIPRGTVPSEFNVPWPVVQITGADGVVVSGVEYSGDKSLSPVLSSDGSGNNWTWDSKLDTFWTPAIGVCPGYFLPDDQLPGDPTAKPKLFHDYGRVLGMDQALDVKSGNYYDRARSIYVVATSIDAANSAYTSFNQGYWVLTGGLNAATGLVDPSPQLIATDSFVTSPPPGGSPWPDPKVDYRGYTVSNPSGVYVGNPSVAGMTLVQGGNLVWATTETFVVNCFNGIPNSTISDVYATGGVIGPHPALSNYAPSSGPPSGITGTKQTGQSSPVLTDTVVIDASINQTHQTYVVTYYFGSTPPSTYFEWNNQIWGCIGIDGTDMDPGTLSHVAATYSSPVNTAILLGELPSIAPQINLTSGSSVVMDASWTKLYASGYHTPAFIGRIDSCYQFGAYEGDGSDASKFNLNSQTDTIEPFGCYTGVDLGQLNINDVVMIATDATKGYIWFGKNGKWYGKSGALNSTSEGPAFGNNWAAVMDGATKSAFPITTPSGTWQRQTAQPQYFPCVSYRLGPGEVNIVFDAGQLKYAPPSGFKVYGQTAV